MIVERRQAMAEALRPIPELMGNVHAYKPDALAPPVGYVDHAGVTRDGHTMRTLELQAEIVLVADGLTMAARQRLDEAGAQAWLALGRVGCTPQTMVDETIGNGPNVTYAAVRLTVTTATECL